MGRSLEPRAGARIDGLRLYAMSRIPRCSGCARFGALLRAHWDTAPPDLPEVPQHCLNPVCAPIAARFSGANGRAEEPYAERRSLPEDRA